MASSLKFEIYKNYKDGGHIPHHLSEFSRLSKGQRLLLSLHIQMNFSTGNP